MAAFSLHTRKTDPMLRRSSAEVTTPWPRFGGQSARAGAATESCKVEEKRRGNVPGFAWSGKPFCPHEMDPQIARISNA
jgi:hypothetical protein